MLSRDHWLALGFALGLLIGSQAPPPPTACAGARTCGEMRSCQQAYTCLREGNARLDGDKDGIPCESLCGG